MMEEVQKVYEYSVIFLVVCKIQSLTLKEEHCWRMFENRMLRKIFGSKREGVTRGWRKLHSDSHCLHPHNMLGWLNQGG
jgi:predicted metal-binding protein